MKNCMREASGTEYDAWLASACMPAGTVRILLQRYQNSFACFQAVKEKDPDIVSVIRPRFMELLRQRSSTDYINRMKEQMERHSIGVLHIHDVCYPKALLDIDDPPALLFYQGDPECLRKRCLGMVGSRAASFHGQKAARKISENLGRHDITIVSGFAGGIDSCAHRGCMDGGSPTIAVTGCGLDRVYPSDNIFLRNDILAGSGLILSEYAPGEKPEGWHFPVRNRIITGLSHALILIEAKIKSGSMTSVRHALEQGKDVFVYPGDPLSDYFEANHQLLREGGIYFTKSEDILEDMHWLDNPSSVGQNSDCSAKVMAGSPEQEAIINALKQGPLGFEQLLSYTRIDPSVMMGTLTILQINGVIEAFPGKQYQLKQ